MQKALGVLEIMNFTQEEREAYENHLKWLMIEANTLKKYEEKGKAIGLKEGEVIGIEKGRTLGIEEGMAKGIESVIINMLEKQISDSVILSMINISAAELSRIKAELENVDK